jgi:hypothetical protein
MDIGEAIVNAAKRLPATVDDKVREVYKLAPGAFLSSERPTGVNCRIITLEKE